MSNNKTYLFQEIFVEENIERLNEYIYCINKNLNNTNIEKIFLVVHQDSYIESKEYYENSIFQKLTDKSKIHLIQNISDRFTFNDFITFSKELVPENSITIVANLDIFIPNDESWKNINKDFFQVTNKNICLSLSRTEYINDDNWFVDETAWNNGEFSDCWVFKTPLVLDENDFPCRVPVGFAPYCDNYMFIILTKKYDYVFNWAEKYRIFHYDIVRKPDVIQTKRGRMIIKDNIHVLSHDFLKRNKNICNLKPRQNWESILNKLKNN